MSDPGRQIFATLFALIACGYVIWRGQTPERIGGGTVLAGWLATAFVVDTAHWDAPQYAVMVIDVAALAVLVALAFRSGRWWPIWAAGIQLAGMSAHILRVLVPDVLPRVYFAMIAFGGYFLALAIVIGTVVEVELPRARAKGVVHPE